MANQDNQKGEKMNFDQVLDLMVGTKVQFVGNHFSVKAVLERTLASDGGWMYHAKTETSKISIFRTREINNIGLTRLGDGSIEVVIRLS